MEQFTRAGLVFDVSDSGAGDDVVVLLHGWPQDRHAWSEVTPLLVEAGLRVVAFDQRGYSPGAQPGGRASYRVAELVGDVVALVEALGQRRVHLVGHDWGGSVAWAFAERHPERLRSLTVVSTPHHRAIAWAVRHADQARRSWYLAAFQLPVLPELVLRRALPTVLRRSGLPEQHVLRYAARFSRPGAASGGLAWYRALPLQGKAAGHRGASVDRRRISTPTSFVWGRHDPALGRAAAERTREYVAADYRFIELDAGHWLPETRAREVADAILERVRTVQQ